MSADGGRAASLLGRAERLSDLLAKRSQLGLLLEKYESQLVDIGLSEPSRRTSTCLDAPPTEPGRDSLGSMCSAGPSGRRSSFERVSEAASVLEEGAPAPAPAWEAHNARSVEVTRDRDNIVKVVKKLDVQLRALLDTAAASAPAPTAHDAAAERARNDQTALARHAFEETPNTEFYDGEEERRMSAWAAHDPLKPLPPPRRQPPHRSAEAKGGAELQRYHRRDERSARQREGEGSGGGAGEGRLPRVDARGRAGDAGGGGLGRRRCAVRDGGGGDGGPLRKRLRQRAAERHIGGDAGGFGSSLSSSGGAQKGDGGGRLRRRAGAGAGGRGG